MLGYMNPPEIVQMLEHYFQTNLTADQRERITLAILAREGKPRLDLTPAQVEQLTAEHEEVDDMIRVLERKGQPVFPLPKSIAARRSGSTGISTRHVSVKYDGS
jgi:hypothetical protein